MRHAALIGIVAAVLPVTAAGIFAAVAPSSDVAPWVGPVVAASGLLVLGAIARRNFGLLGLGFALSAVAAIMAVPAAAAVLAPTPDDWPFHDLSDGPLPAPPPHYIAVRGHYRTGWVLNEYAVEPGQRPNQAEQADAVLVPLTPSEDDVVSLDGAVVVVRVRPGVASEGEASTVRGVTSPLNPDLLHTLIAVSGTEATTVRGVLVDTLAVPSRDGAFTDLLLASLALAGAIGCVWFGARRPVTRPDT